VRRARRGAVTALALGLQASAGVDAAGGKHALLIGVGRYSYLPKATLEGPPFDVQSLQAVLSRRFGFDPRNISVLLDEKATRPAILAAINDLAARTRPGDFVFIYFSGHGTSGYDPALKEVGLDGATGALVPADFKPAPPADLKKGLIIGSRDLRPLLERLDGQRDVLVAFDSCFSGNAAREVFAAGEAKYVAPADLVTAEGRAVATFAGEEEPFGAQTVKDPPFPYQTVVYLSAASKSERAMDIGSNLIRSGRVKTVDGQPHGAFTNAFIEGLNGSADTNGDGTVTNEELYRYVKDEVTERFPHQPQLLMPDKSREALLHTPVLGGARSGAPAPTLPPAPLPAASPPAASPASFRVKTQGLAPAVAATISGIPGVTVTTGAGAYDLLVVHDAQGFKLVHPSGDEIGTYEPSQIAEVLQRISRQVAVQALIDLRFPDQDFNATVEIPGNRGFLRQGEPFTIEFSAERDSHVLLMDIDSQGYVSVLYPFDAAEARPVRKGRVPASGELKVSPPFGTDYVKIIAFQEKPVGFEHWMGASGQHFSPTGPELAPLLRMITTAKGSKAQARVKVVTRGPGG
jgi:caspase domain-containing protein/uncharacterized protein DUF4384